MQKVGAYVLQKPLGDGYSGVVTLGIHSETGQKAAIKFPLPEHLSRSPKIPQFIAAEAEMLRTLQHPNIIRLLDYKAREIFVNTASRQVFEGPMIALELAEKGELCQLICEVGRLSENTSRYLFLQLLSALSYIHSRGLAHRDIKPENLLLDSQYKLKVIDFAFTCAGGNCSNKVGTSSYFAPEIFLKDSYNAQSADIFAAGVVLFIMALGIPPFNEARTSDPYFKFFATKPETFWKYHKRADPKGVITQEFQKLIHGMLSPEPANRWNLTQVAESSWVRIPVDEALAVRELQDLSFKLQTKKNTI